jgi:GNAT superfamily N-acetyltransferase
MRRPLPDGYELDDDPSRVNIDAVHEYLSDESYWARGRDRELVARSISASARVIGLYRGSDLVGFARVVSDGVAIAWLADLYVLEAHRGRGLGAELVREAVEHGPHARLRWLLATEDAHGLYAQFGFGPPRNKLERPPRP